MNLSWLESKRGEVVIRLIEVGFVVLVGSYFSWTQMEIGKKQAEVAEKEMLVADKQLKLAQAATPIDFDIRYSPAIGQLEVLTFRDDVKLLSLAGLVFVEKKMPMNDKLCMVISNMFITNELIGNHALIVFDPEAMEMVNNAFFDKDKPMTLSERLSRETKVIFRVKYQNAIGEIRTSYIANSNHFVNKAEFKELPDAKFVINYEDYVNKNGKQIDHFFQKVNEKLK